MIRLVKKLAKNNTRESNPVYNIRDRIVSYNHEDNNYRKAIIEAFELLSSQKQRHPKRHLEFNQELCKTLVIKYGLSCLNCKLKCELHEWEAMK